MATSRIKPAAAASGGRTSNGQQPPVFLPHLLPAEASDVDALSARPPEIRPAPIACCEAGATKAPAGPAATAAQKANSSSCEVLLLLLPLLMLLKIFMLMLFTPRDSACRLLKGTEFRSERRLSHYSIAGPDPGIAPAVRE